LREIRLDLARRDLLLGRAGSAVTELAIPAGFRNPGRFAGCYEERYGEVPSDTMRRAPLFVIDAEDRFDASHDGESRAHLLVAGFRLGWMDR
jgi:AraC-like DNA-binding protein